MGRELSRRAVCDSSGKGVRAQGRGEEGTLLCIFVPLCSSNSLTIWMNELVYLLVYLFILNCNWT